MLDGVLDIFALIATVDGRVSEQEIGYVRSYLEALHPPEHARELLQLFVGKAEARLDPAGAIETLRARYGYEDAVFLLWKAFELLGSEEILPVESERARAIGLGLGLRAVDLRLIELYNLRRNVPDPEPDPTSTIWRLRFSDEPGPDTVRLPLEGLRLEAFAVGQRYYVRQLDTLHTARLGGRNFPPHFLTRFRSDEPLTVDAFEFRHVDVTFYLRQLARRGQPKSLYIEAEGISVGAYEEAGPNTALRIDLSELSITASALREGPAVLLNRRPLTGSRPVIPSDQIVVGDTPVDLRRVLFHHATDSFEFNDSADRCRISNGFSTDLHVVDDSLVRWEAAVQKQGSALRLERGDCPHRIVRGGRSFQDGEELRVGEEFSVGPQRIAVGRVEEDGSLRLRCLPPGVEIYAAENLSHRFLDQSLGLDNISFEARRGELLCILGPSGSGKSTLMSVLTGVISPSAGEVRINQASLRTNPHLQDRIGYVPQDDLLFENLTVFENLYFGARLRCSALSDQAVRAKVERVQRETGLRERRDVKVGSPIDKTLSGGERKRLNIGLELTGENDILVLDEPTSGLSSYDAFRVIELLRQRTYRGDIVFVVAHQPSARLLQMFDKLLMLDRGGRLAFFGAIESAFSYFGVGDVVSAGTTDARGKIGDPGLLFDALEQARLRIDGTPDEERQHSPTYWQKKFQSHRETHFQRSDTPAARPPSSATCRECRRMVQFSAAFRRELTNKLRNRANLLVSVATASALALFVALACRAFAHVPVWYEQPDYRLADNPALTNFLFLTAIVAQFLALAGSVQEIVKDRAILLRERMLKIPSTFYLAGKFCTSMLVLVAQLAAYILISFFILQIHELHFRYWALLCVVGAAGVAAGLLVSALPRITEKMASNIIPLLLVPQIIFGGAEPFPFTRMAHLAWSDEAREAVRKEHRPPGLAQLMPSRWGYESLLSLQRDYSREFKSARGYREAKSAIEVYGSSNDNGAKAREHLHLYGSAADSGGRSRSEWEELRDSAQQAPGYDRGDEFFRKSEEVISFKTLPSGRVVSPVYYNTGVLLLMAGLLLGATLALLRYSRRIDELANETVQFFRRVFSALRARLRSRAISRGVPRPA